LGDLEVILGAFGHGYTMG